MVCFQLRKLISSCITADQTLRPDIVYVYNTAHEMNNQCNSQPLFPPRTSLRVQKLYNIQRTPSTVSIAPEHEKRYFKNHSE